MLANSKPIVYILETCVISTRVLYPRLNSKQIANVFQEHRTLKNNSKTRVISTFVLLFSKQLDSKPMIKIFMSVFHVVVNW